MIEQLESNFKRRLEINDSNILCAYRNHLQRVTRELTNLKEIHEQHEQKYSSDKVIINLTKQCALFRQEAMRLHSQLEDSMVDCDIYKRKAELSAGEVKATNKRMKELLDKNRKLEKERDSLKA